MEVKANITDDLIVNALDSADIGYWVRRVEGCGDHAGLLKGNRTAIVIEDDGSRSGRQHVLDAAKVRQGVQLMLEKYPNHYADMLADNADCITGDVLVQLALLGEIVYG